MSTVVQSSYRPQIAPAVVGLVANEISSSVKSKTVETAAGIGFGLAVSQGTRDDGVILGGSAFIGVTVRDVTLALSPVDPLSDTLNTLDKYGRYTNAAVLSRGDIWVRAGANVVAGNPASYDTTTGAFSTGTSGLAASGSIVFSSQPAADANIVVNGVTVTFKASGATGDQVNIGATLGDTIARLATLINASATAGLAAVEARALPPSPGGAGQGSGANELYVAAVAPGVAGNAFTLTAGTTAGATASAATLLGGTASSTAITGGRWSTAAVAGELAILSLGIQQ